jgi:hypothetical protein
MNVAGRGEIEIADDGDTRMVVKPLESGGFVLRLEDYDLKLITSIGLNREDATSALKSLQGLLNV